VANAKSRILPMKTKGTQHFIERTYRESGTFQWVRETYKNAEEADATKVEFGVEWQAVERLGVYRRVIADNGKGMSPDQLVEFFNTFGGGGKPIGGLHENYGMGSKTSLLPWNRRGMVVISWVDGDAAMIWVQHDPESGEYGLRLEEVVDEEGEISLDEVFLPYDDPDEGCDWSAVKPSWIGDHGTVIVLLGNDAGDDTVLGDPNRDERDIKGISSYLNRRLWTVPDGVEVYVDELRNTDREQWPSNEREARTQASQGEPDRRTNNRRIRGARHFIEYPVPAYRGGQLDSSGDLSLSDGTTISWFLWGGDRPAVHSYAARSGYIAALYEDELYDITTHQANYRSFGITEQEVRARVWLIARPPLADVARGRHGVYPRTDRNSLLLLGGPNAGGELPMNEWAAEFAEHMPERIVDAIKASRTKGGGTITDNTWRERLADRFGSRWRVSKLRARAGGALLVDPAQVGTASKKKKVKKNGKKKGGGAGGQSGAPNTGEVSGKIEAVRTRVAGGLPNYRPVRAGDGVSPEMLAAWAPNDPTEQPAGAVLINVDHPVLVAEIKHWQDMYPDHLTEQIGDEVVRVYGEMAVAKVAHSEHLRGLIPSKEVDDQLRSEAALTMSLLGLIGEEAILAPRISGKYRKRRDL
jgi:hypothetical protein